MEEALRRAEAYHRSGADAVLMHSKRATPDEILEFMRRWGGRGPVVIVPTIYYQTPTETFEQAGVSLVIWANHLMRSCIQVMRKTAATILADRSIRTVEGQVAPLRDVFQLQDVEELEAAEEQYLPRNDPVPPVVPFVTAHPAIKDGKVAAKNAKAHRNGTAHGHHRKHGKTAVAVNRKT
jgi:phosphoenolpyruvate phosphomutase